MSTRPSLASGLSDSGLRLIAENDFGALRVCRTSNISTGAIQRCAGYGKDSAKEGSPTMATTKLSDEALLAFFSKPSGASRQNGVDRRGGGEFGGKPRGGGRGGGAAGGGNAAFGSRGDAELGFGAGRGDGTGGSPSGRDASPR